jgi:hypothetical protein
MLDEALRDAFDLDTLRRMLWYRLGFKLEEIVSSESNLRTAVEKVIQTARQRGSIWKLVRAALEENPSNELLREFVATYPQYDKTTSWIPPHDPYEAYLLRAQRFFINRVDFRVALRDLSKSDGERVLVINGERGSGKTYSREMINYLTEVLDDHKALYVDLDMFEYRPDDLAATIGRQMGRDVTTMPKQYDEQVSRWTHNLCDWIFEDFIKNERFTWWFVFDGFRQRLLQPETRDLIGELATRAEGPVRQCRLVLLNYTEMLPADIDCFIKRETIRSIGREDLIPFFNHLFSVKGRALTAAETEYIVDEVIAQVDEKIAAIPNGSQERLRLLSRAVSNTMRRLCS